jgi:DNA modification methylase
VGNEEAGTSDGDPSSQKRRKALMADLGTRFEEIDWSFEDSPVRGEPDIHPYPARFIPEIPRAALDVLAPDGPVLDPFCGSGTTLVESARRGLHSIGVDLNPIACLITRVKTEPWLGNYDHALGERFGDELVASASEGDQASLKELHEEIPRLDHWFEPWAQEFLAGAVAYLRDIPTGPWRDRLALAISAVTVRVSRQDSDTRYAAVEKNFERTDAARELRLAVRRISDWLSANSLTGTSEVLCQNAQSLDGIDDRTVAAAIFSPPYPNAYEYWLYHKYRMYWLGFDPIAVRTAEIGARPHYCKPNGMDENDFAAQMEAVFSELHRVLRPGGAVLVVVGDSQIRGRFVDNGDVLTNVASSTGFKPTASTMRPIRQTSSSFNRAHSRARSGEHVLLYEKAD